MYLSDVRGACQHIRNNTVITKIITDDLGPPAAPSDISDSFWICPFHGETKPSFGVHPQLGIWRCFGCSEGGDAITWMQKYHGMSIVEAVATLATKYGLDVSKFLRPPTPEELQVERYKKITNVVADCCHMLLIGNKTILQWYLQDTGFNIEKVTTYGIGYSASSDYIIQETFQKIPDLTQDDVTKLELANKMMWGNALVYPIRDASGHPCLFRNKPLTPGLEGGKYLGNSTKHPLFSHKLLFGFDIVRKNLKDSKHKIRVVEGQKAAMAANAVAVMGTQISDQQIQLLDEHNVKEIVFGFDGDEAGQMASVRLLDKISAMGSINILVAKFPQENYQADTYIKAYGQEALDKLFSEAVLPIQFYIDRHRDKQGSISINDRFRLVNELSEYLSSMSEVHLDLNAQYLHDALGIDKHSIKAFVCDTRIAKTGLVNKEAETTVLKNALDFNSWPSIKQMLLTSKAFATSGNQYLYEAIDSAHKKAKEKNIGIVTPQSIKDELKILYPQYSELSGIVDAVIAAESKYGLDDAIHKVVDLYRRRIGIEQSKTMASTLQDLGKDTQDILSKFRRELISSLDVKKDEITTPIQIASALYKEVAERMMKGSAIIGHDFSILTDVDGHHHKCLTGLCMAMSGLQQCHNVILSANTGVGKSILATQMITSLAISRPPEDQVPTLFIPLEMTENEITMRIVSLLAGLNNSRVQAGVFTAEEFFRFKKAESMIAASQFYMKKPRTGTIDEVLAIIDEYVFRYGIKMVVLDYIGLIQPGEIDIRLSREQVLGRASKIMKNQVAEGMRLVSVVVAQQNKDKYEEGQKRTAEQVAGSYQIPQDADDLLVLVDVPPNMREDNNGCNRKCFIDKRRGGVSDVCIPMNVDFESTVNLRFTENMSPQQLAGLTKNFGMGG